MTIHDEGMFGLMGKIINDLGARYQADTSPLPDAPGQLCLRVRSEGFSRLSSSIFKAAKKLGISDEAGLAHGGGEVDCLWNVQNLARAEQQLRQMMRARWPKLSYEIHRTPSSDEIMAEYEARIEQSGHAAEFSIVAAPLNVFVPTPAAMDFSPQEAQRFKQQTIQGMLDFMKHSRNVGYTKQDVDDCEKILDDYLAWAESPQAEQQVLDVTRTTVLALNALNKKCRGTLIETDQRESICAMILGAAKGAGLNRSDDITEEWREW